MRVRITQGFVEGTWVYNPGQELETEPEHGRRLAQRGLAEVLEQGRADPADDGEGPRRRNKGRNP